MGRVKSLRGHKFWLNWTVLGYCCGLRRVVNLVEMNEDEKWTRQIYSAGFLRDRATRGLPSCLLYQRFVSPQMPESPEEQRFQSPESGKRGHHYTKTDIAAAVARTVVAANRTAHVPLIGIARAAAQHPEIF
jgi:hypothetical protein